MCITISFELCVTYALQCTLIGQPGLPAAPLAVRGDNREVYPAQVLCFTPLFPRAAQMRSLVTTVAMGTASLTTHRACRFARVWCKRAQVLVACSDVDDAFQNSGLEKCV